MSTLRGGVQFTRKISRLHWEDIMKNVGKIIGKTIEFVLRSLCTEHLPVYS